MKRLAIYLFFDPKGVIRSYNIYYLRKLQEVCKRLILVSNGEIEPASMRKVENLGIDIYERPNEGFDVAAYKDTLINKVGWTELHDYDELIICNYTCYGPVYPFQEMLNEMESRECDFWGAAKHPEQPTYLLPNYKGYIYEHIMSYFLVIRNRMLCSEDFRLYWETVPEIHNKNESVALHETQFTRHFEELGFVSDAYVDLGDYEGRCYNNSIFLANELVEKSKCPLVKRRAFFFPDYEGLIKESDTHEILNLLDYIRDNTNYDVDMIWEDLLATSKMSMLINNMHLGQVVCQDNREERFGVPLLVAVYLPNDRYISIFKQYFDKLHENVTVAIFFDARMTSSIKEAFENRENVVYLPGVGIGKCPTYSSVVRLRNIIKEYEYVCLLTNYGMTNSALSIGWEDFAEYIYSNMVSSDVLRGIVRLFEKDRRLGAVVPRETAYGRYYAHHIQRMECGLKSKLLREYDDLELDVPFDDELYTNLEGAFWLTKESYNIIDCFLRNTEKKYDKSLLDFFIPMILQSRGRYTTTVISEGNARVLLDINQWNRHRFIEYAGGVTHAHPWDARSLRLLMRGERVCQGTMRKQDALDLRFSFRELVLLLKKYPRNWIEYKRGQRRSKMRTGNVVPAIYLTGLFLDGGRIRFSVFFDEKRIKEIYIRIGKKKIYPIHEKTHEETEIQTYMKEYFCRKEVFFQVPLYLEGCKIEFFRGNSLEPIQWAHGINYNAFDLHEVGLYARVDAVGALRIEKKGTFAANALLSREYSLRDKLLFLVLFLNPIHKIAIMGENFGAGDNTFEVYKQAIKEKRRDAYYVCSDSVLRTEKDKNLRKNMVVFNSKKHHFLQAFVEKWIGSYSFQAELVTKTKSYKDIHMNMIPGKWYFIPHGMALGDREVAMLYHFHWGDPYRTYTNCLLEKKAYSEKYHFSNVKTLGSPRMDKWNDGICDEQQVVFFFTWRMGLSDSRVRFDDSTNGGTYVSIIISLVKKIRKKFRERKLIYVFHHEVIKAGVDSIIQKYLKKYITEFISLTDKVGVDRFNSCFRTAKYLITDFSSVAYDFAYKKGAMVINYMPDEFIEHHYTIDESFFNNQLGMVAKSEEAVLDLLMKKKPSSVEESRRSNFFYMRDNKNAWRVYRDIFGSKQKTEHKKDIVNGMYHEKKRLAIFMFWDKEGIVDDYVFTFLNGLHQCCENVCVVINGTVGGETVEKLKETADYVLQRENKGFDSWAYRHAIEYYGYETLANQYDEIVLCNYTCYGPLYSFKNMFSEMDSHECDFWGHIRYIPLPGQRLEKTIMPEHIQSHFIVFRKSILASRSFKEYWATLQLPNNYTEAILFHELRCTKFFEERGFLSDSFIREYSYPLFSWNAPVYMAYPLIKRDKSPLIKRKVFAVENGEFRYPLHTRETVYDVIDYIKKHTNYDVNQIYSNIERTYDIAFSTSEKRKKEIENKVEALKHQRKDEYQICMEKNRIYDSEVFRRSFAN